MNFYFDYIYYRISKLYYKYDKGKGVYGFTYIMLTEGVLLFDLLMFVERFFFGTQRLQGTKIDDLIISVVIILPVTLFNYFKYIRPKGKYEHFDIIGKMSLRQKESLRVFWY